MLVTSQEDNQGIDQPIAGRKAYFTVSDISKAFLYFRPHIQRRQAQFLREDEKNIIQNTQRLNHSLYFGFPTSLTIWPIFDSVELEKRQSEAWKKAKEVLPVN